VKRLTKIKFDEFLLNQLVCPVTKTKLIFDAKKNELVSKKAKLAYPINKGIPVLLKEKARKL
tara:strand:- start:297 stop:482 length:186 start_codon:yes stop_codon:yes gene_type:complete